MGCPYEVVYDGPHDDKWLEERRKSVGASESPGIVGLSSFGSPLEVFADKIGAGKPFEANEAMEWGVLLEPVVIAEYARKSGREVLREGRLLRSLEWPFLSCTPDAMHTDTPIGPVQAKVTRHVWIDQAPKWVWAQVQHELAVTGADVGVAVALCEGTKLLWETIKRDDDYIQNTLVPTCRAFWDAVVAQIAPRDFARTNEDALKAILNRISLVEVGKTIHLGGEWVEKHIERESLIEQRRKTKERLLEIENDFRLEMDDAETALLPNRVQYTLKEYHKPARVQQVKESHGRTLRCKIPKESP